MSSVDPIPATPIAPEAASPATHGEPSQPSFTRVLESEEASRALVFFRAFFLLAVAVCAFLPFLGGSVRLRTGIAITLAAGMLLCVFALRLLRDESRVTPGRVGMIGVGSVLVAVLVVYYIGIFSAATMALALGLYFFGASRHRAAARVTYASLVISYFVVSAGVASKRLPDIALFPVTGAATTTQWFQVVMSQLILGMTYYLARRNRHAMEGALERVQRATMQIRQRDAQLAEARRELDRVLKPGEGRYTGQVFGGYRLGLVLGHGGMGEVYRAVHTDTGEEAAVKLLHPNLLADETHLKRFLREGEVASAVHSQHVVQLRARGRGSEGTPYLVMELVEGHDLGWHLRKNGRLPLAAVVDLIEQVALALAVMRDVDIVHRDLKPANVILTDAIPQRWKVLDFGLSKMLNVSGSILTQDQAVGTPSYMAPEQIEGEVDHRTDIYGATALAYRALTGSPPFDGEKPIEIALKVVNSQPADPARFASVPRDVERVLAIGLAKNPADRFQKIEELAHAMRDAAAGALPPETRLRATRILRRAPWGSTVSKDKISTSPGYLRPSSDFVEEEETVAE